MDAKEFQEKFKPEELQQIHNILLFLLANRQGIFMPTFDGWLDLALRLSDVAFVEKHEVRGEMSPKYSIAKKGERALTDIQSYLYPPSGEGV